MLIIGVHKAFIHAGRWINHRSSTKKRYKVFYIDEETGKFGSFFTDPLSAAVYRLQKCKRRTGICLACGSRSVMYYRNEKELKETSCPICGQMDEEIQEALKKVISESA